MKKLMTFLALMGIALCLTTGAAAETKSISISTGSMGGGFYAIGGGMAEYITKHVEGVRCTAVTSGGVDENINRLDMGTADIGLVSTGDSHMAYKGMAAAAAPKRLIKRKSGI